MSANPGTYSPTIYRGLTFHRVFTYRDGEGDLVDLTGYSATYHLAPTTTYQSNLIEYTSGDPELALGDAAGTITLTIDADATALLPVGTLVHALKMTAPDGSVQGLFIGNPTISDRAI